MRFPPRGTWVRVIWRDAEAEGVWQDPGEERPRTIEVSAGIFRGFSTDGKMLVPGTVSVRLDNGKLHSKLSELEIPVGCIVRIVRDPPIDLRDLPVLPKRRSPKAKEPDKQKLDI